MGGQLSTDQQLPRNGTERQQVINTDVTPAGIDAATTVMTDLEVENRHSEDDDDDCEAVEDSYLLINKKAYLVENILHYDPDDGENTTLTAGNSMVGVMKINSEAVEAPIHPWTINTKKNGGCRPRCYPTSAIIDKLQPILIDNRDGADMYEIEFNDHSKNLVFFAHKDSKYSLLREIHRCYSEDSARIALLCKHLPPDLLKRDCLAGGEYLPAGIAKRGKVTGSTSKLPFVVESNCNRIAMELYDLYARILGLEAQVLKEYYPEEYSANHQLYNEGEDCIFPSPQEQQHNPNVNPGVYWGLHQVALRTMGCESSNDERAERRMALHVDQSDVKSNQLLTFLPMGGKNNKGGHVLDSDLMVFEHKNGGKCFRLNTSIEDTVVFILMNSGRQLHGSAMDSSIVGNVENNNWSARFIAYGRNNVLYFVDARQREGRVGEAFRKRKMKDHKQLDWKKAKVGDKVSATFGKRKQKLEATLVKKKNKMFFLWDCDETFTECRKKMIFSVECARAKNPHECNHCNPYLPPSPVVFG